MRNVKEKGICEMWDKNKLVKLVVFVFWFLCLKKVLYGFFVLFIVFFFGIIYVFVYIEELSCLSRS